MPEPYSNEPYPISAAVDLEAESRESFQDREPEVTSRRPDRCFPVAQLHRRNDAAYRLATYRFRASNRAHHQESPSQAERSFQESSAWDLPVWALVQTHRSEPEQGRRGSWLQPSPLHALEPGSHTPATDGGDCVSFRSNATFKARFPKPHRHRNPQRGAIRADMCLSHAFHHMKDL